MRPLVSIITVTKNCVSTIERTLKSIEMIKDSDIQYIIIDGGSDDGTLSAIGRYNHIVDILISEGDSGIYNAMNKGAAVAGGRYILYVNGDDYILADGFNKARDILTRKVPEVMSCQSETFEIDGSKGIKLRPSLLRLFFYNSIPHLSAFVSTELQKRYKFRENFRIAADYDFFLRLFLKGHRFLLSELITSVHYRGGVSNNLIQATAEIAQIRRDNLGTILYVITRAMEWLNKFRRLVIRKCRSIVRIF